MVTVWSAITSHLLFSQPPYPTTHSGNIDRASYQQCQAYKNDATRNKTETVTPPDFACSHQGKEFVIKSPVYGINFRILVILVKHYS
jgi:hypothetical protein